MSSQHAPAETRTGLPAAGRPLRPLQGGYDITEWPVAVPARPGELAESWLIRVGHRYALPPGTILRAARPGSQVAWPVTGRDTAVAAVAALLRSEAPSTGRGPANAAIAAWTDRYGRRTARRRGSLLCPACLGEPDPYWRAEWASPLELVCARHEVLLVGECPRCARRPFASVSWGQESAPLWRCPSQIDSPGRTHRTHRRWCGGDLRSAPHLPATRGDLDAQQFVRSAVGVAATAPSSTVKAPIGDWSVTATEHADALLELLDEQLPASSWDEVAPRTLLDAVKIAVDVLAADSPGGLAALSAAHGALDPSGDHTPLRPGRRHRHPRSPVLMSLLLTSTGEHLSLGDRLMYRTASARPRPPVRTEFRVGSDRRAEGVWPARGWVPPILWDGILTQHVTDRGPYARAALSLALSKIGSNAPMRAIAVDLGLPGWLADRISSVLRRRTSGQMQGLTRDLEALFTALEAAPPPINYSQRVQEGRDTDRLRAAAIDAAGFQGVVVHEPEEAVFTALLWAAYTGSDPGLCPALDPGSFAPRWPVGLDVEDFLSVAYEQLPHHAGEPLTWRPP